MIDNFKRVSRRNFLKSMAYGAAALSSLSIGGCSHEVKPSRIGASGIFNQEGKPLLVAVEGNNPQKMMEKAFDAIGGLKPLLGKGKKVLLKGNFVFAQPFPITTDPQIALLFGRHLNDAGERSEFIMTQDSKWKAYSEIGVHKDIYTTPVIINMPCLKRHHTSYLTCALKNNFGAVYGPQRWDAHIRGEGIKKMTRLKAESRQEDKFRNIYHFMDAIAEFADAVRPELTFVDARSILTKGGPTAGIGKIKTGVNLFILSQDMVATDVYCSKLMEKHDDAYSTEMILPYLKTAEKLGLGTMDLNKVKIMEISA